ncbi:MAG: glycosyltransferase family 4 protein [Candidatus Omnitrophica bacterium]|nr:glycosyltransferase family 4 protein [Candidatus Omnitrophota bacterium]
MDNFLGSIDFLPFQRDVRVSKDNMVYGAWIASQSFYRALLKYGTFKEYHFFVNGKREIDDFKECLGRASIRTDRVRVIAIDKLKYLKRINYIVFFTTGTSLSQLSFLREYVKKYSPLCGMAFETLSYPRQIKDVFLNNIISEIHYFDTIICNSRGVYKYVQKLNKLLSNSFYKKFGLSLKYCGRIDYLPFGIDTTEYNLIDKTMAKKRLGLPMDKLIILYFGRFSIYDKADLDPLLIVFKEIVSKEKNILLLLSGVNMQGNYGFKVKNLARELGILSNVKFIFNVKNKDIVYSASDIFVSPVDNIQESFGLTILEAMAFGLPTVVSDWNGYKDTVIHGKTGFLIPTYWINCYKNSFDGLLWDYGWQREHLYLSQSVCVDIKKMKEYLTILVGNKNLRLLFGNNAKNIIKEKYDWQVLIPLYERLWIHLSELAKSSKIISHRRNLFVPEYFFSFSHYPTHILDSETKFILTNRGRMFLKTKVFSSIIIPQELSCIISIRIIFFILNFLYEKRMGDIKEIVAYTKKVFKDVSTGDIRYNIMWLFKKGFISFFQNK